MLLLLLLLRLLATPRLASSPALLSLRHRNSPLPLLRPPTPPPGPAAATTTLQCSTALAGCWPVRDKLTKCRLCEGKQQHHLRVAGCTEQDIQLYCGDGSNTAPPLLTPEVVVAVAPGASEQESWAAYMLAAGLGLALGGPTDPYKYCSHPFAGGSTGKCGVVHPADVGNRSAIYVGLQAATDAGLHPSDAELRAVGEDGFLCSASYTGSAFRVALTGAALSPRRGTINAVMVYLNRLGLRWWTPWKDVDPTWDGPGMKRGETFGMNLTMPGCQGRRLFTPAFQYRSILSKGVMSSSQSSVWNVQNHLNGGGDRTGNCKPLIMPASMGGLQMFSNGTCAASVYVLVPPLSCTPPPWPGHPPGSKPGFCHVPSHSRATNPYMLDTPTYTSTNIHTYIALHHVTYIILR